MRRPLGILVLTLSVFAVLAFLITSCGAAPTATPVPQLAQPTATKPPAAAATTAPAAAATAVPATPTKPPVTPTPAATSAGKVTIVLAEELFTLEHFYAHGAVNYPAIRNIQEALLNRDPKTNEIVGDLATKWEQVKPDTWRFTLRKDVKFHNGEPLESTGVAYGIERNYSKVLSSPMREFIGPEMTAKPVDPLTVDVVTEAPDPILPLRLYFAPIPEMKWAKANPEEIPIKPVGTGPYKFVEWNRGQYLKLTANENYWGGAPKIKDVTFVWRKESAVRAAMIKTGEGDMARWITPSDCKPLPQCMSTPSVETLFMRPDISPLAPGAPNLLADKRVRQAISHAIDRKSIVDKILEGNGVPASQLIGPFVNGFNPNLKPREFDKEKAKKLLADAKAAGIKTDVPLTVFIRSGYIARISEAAEAVAAMLGDVGLAAKIQGVEASVHRTTFRIKPMPGDRLALHLHGNEMGDASATTSKYMRGATEISTYCNKDIEAEDAKASQLVGEPRTKAYQALMAKLYEEEPTIPVAQLLFAYGATARLDWKPRLDGLILVREMSLK